MDCQLFIGSHTFPLIFCCFFLRDLREAFVGSYWSNVVIISFFGNSVLLNFLFRFHFSPNKDFQLKLQLTKAAAHRSPQCWLATNHQPTNQRGLCWLHHLAFREICTNTSTKGNTSKLVCRLFCYQRTDRRIEAHVASGRGKMDGSGSSVSST